MIRTLALALMLFIGLALHVDHQNLGEIYSWQHYKAVYGERIQHEEEMFRRAVFEHNLAIIKAHNADLSQTYQMGVNHFTIYTKQEFVHLFLTPGHLAVTPTRKVSHLKMNRKEIHADIDWVSLGRVAPVKNQGTCNAGWAFSAIAVVQSYLKINKQASDDIDLSEQQLIDCSRQMGNQGCISGSYQQGWDYMIGNGITSESDYPYVARDQTCKIQGGPYKIGGYDEYRGCREVASQLNKSPISVTVDATNWSAYRSGVFSNCATQSNHAVLLVGIIDDVWKIKNSWGSNWGESGYIRLATGNTCAVCNYAGSVTE